MSGSTLNICRFYFPDVATARLPFINGAERSRALHSSGIFHMDQNLENLIRERAYEIWTSHGCVHGQADQHWIAAERES
jgi:Protein of unknown function (DUF2934)